MVFYLFLYQKNPGYWQNYDFTNWSRNREVNSQVLAMNPRICANLFFYKSPREIPSGYVKHSYGKWPFSHS